MTQPAPYLSVVIASQRVGPELCATLDSFPASGCSDFEIVVQGLAASDRTAPELCRRSAAFRERLRFGTEPDTGLYDAFNKAVDLCRGEWTVFIGAGDFCLAPHLPASIVAALRQVPDRFDFCAFPVARVFPSRRPIDVLRPSATPLKDLPHGMCLPHPGLFHRRRLFSRRRFSTNLRIAGDYEFVCRTVTETNVRQGDLTWLGMPVGGLSSSLETLPLSNAEQLTVAQQYFPQARLLRSRLRLLHSRTIRRLAGLFGRPAAEQCADLARLLRGQGRLWTSPAWKAPGPLPPLSAEPRIDLVVATLGRTAPLERLLRSLRHQTCRNFRIHIADQNPKGFLDDVLAAHADLPLTHTLLPFRNASQARNAVLPLCTGDILGFPDDDCMYAPDTLERVLELFGRRPDAGALVASLVYVRHMDALPRSPAPDLCESSPLSLYGCFYRNGTAAFFIRKAVADRIGGFAPDLGPCEAEPYGCGEDIDFQIRAWRTGYTVLRAHRARIFHPQIDFHAPFAMRKAAAYARGRMALCAAHGLPWWFRVLNIAYPLVMLPADALRHGKSGAGYRWIMFWTRLTSVFGKRTFG